MRSRVVCACVMLTLGLAASTVVAQTADTLETPPVGPPPVPVGAVADTEAPVIQYDLSGPRIGATFMPNGISRSQFGWHVENQASPGTRGPWFLVERVFLVGGVERNQFIPSGTLVFGVRTPSSVEFGIGPSVTFGPQAVTTAVVVATGSTLRYGGIHVPVNLAVAMSQRDHVSGFRVTLLTGWAIKQPRAPEGR